MSDSGAVQGCADLVGLDFAHGAPFAFGGLVAALAESPGDDDPCALLEGLGDVLVSIVIDGDREALYARREKI